MENHSSPPRDRSRYVMKTGTKTLRIAVVFVASLLGCDVSSPVRNVTACDHTQHDAGDPVLAIYTTDLGRPVVTREDVEAILKARKAGEQWTPKPREPRVIIAAWGDGRIVWSTDQKVGGRPYSTGRIDAGRIDALVTSLKDAGIINELNRDLSYCGPDAPTTVIRICHAKGQLRLESWHELHEGPHIVATDHGLVFVDFENDPDLVGIDTQAVNTTRAQGQAMRSEEYLTFLQHWSALKRELMALIPKDGTDTADVRFTYDDFR
jgi:hypothetical protein